MGFLALFAPKIFTFHYVSIKSKSRLITQTTTRLFTFHYVSIKSFSFIYGMCCNFNLHSTMYLLNLGLYITDCPIPAEFTFHYVSIKSTLRPYASECILLFTFHYVSIKSKWLWGYMYDSKKIYIPLCIY